ncbi:hypothetical protein [Flavobacterium sp.]|uniref:hypothetical protein n=1 Tax=Flavobacterium sp. TaxID=239 RepID=UPI00286D2B12|nr:hypothetical protein [Flavobacterium sp.]
MKKSKIYKFLGAVVFLSIIAAGIFYWQLPNRHKAIVKSYLLYKTGIIDNQWDVSNDKIEYKMISPDFYIDGIYRSMEGPKATNYVQLTTDSSLIYITGFKVKAIDSKTKATISKDFICHTNIDFNDVSYYSIFNLKNRIGKQYPRMATLSHGFESYEFPKGYGVPMKGKNLLYISTQALNHNLKDIRKLIKHEVTIRYSKDRNTKPLMCRTIFIELPFDENDPYKSPLDPASNMCVPVETKNHVYQDQNGNKLSGHWVIQPGKKTFTSDVNGQLEIKDSLRLHAATIHVHPFSTAIILFDKTTQKVIFKSKITNHTDRIGITKIESFTSEDGIWLYNNHDYELQLNVNNTTNNTIEMMGSMSLFFYDKELDAILKGNELSD